VSVGQFQPNFFFIYSPETLQIVAVIWALVYRLLSNGRSCEGLTFPAVLLIIDVDARWPRFVSCWSCWGRDVGLVGGLGWHLWPAGTAGSLRIMVDERQSGWHCCIWAVTAAVTAAFAG
jgi:hypothetical protein